MQGSGISRHLHAMNKIALVMIVRDEARSLERCLVSACPWVDEMVVLDTGSRDATPAIARRMGARVTEFTWINDFAAARNAALALTDAPWRLVLDADEWITHGGACLDALRRQPADALFQINVTSLLDASEGAGRGEAPSWLPRLLPRGVAYEGRIHEQPATALPRRRLPLLVAHDGYLGAQQAAKAGRNERLLTLALAEQPEDAYLHYQLGKDFEVRARFEEAAPHYRRALALAEPCAAWRHDLVVRSLFTLKKTGSFDEAVALAAAEAPRWPASPDFHFTLGDLYLDCAAAAPAAATGWLAKVESSWLRALEIGEQPQLADSVRGRGSFLAAHNLSVLHAGLGRSREAAGWRERSAAMRRQIESFPDTPTAPGALYH